MSMHVNTALIGLSESFRNRNVFISILVTHYTLRIGVSVSFCSYHSLTPAPPTSAATAMTDEHETVVKDSVLSFWFSPVGGDSSSASVFRDFRKILKVLKWLAKEPSTHISSNRIKVSELF